MEKQTLFINRYPSKGEFPSKDNKDYCSNVGMVYFRKLKFYFRDEQLITFTDKVEWFFEEIEPPSEEEIEQEEYQNFIQSDRNYYFKDGFRTGANFILNHLKSNTNGN